MLEELPEVVGSIKEFPPHIEPIKHDRFKPQPELAKGVKAYFLSNVLPDWPNEEAKIILFKRFERLRR